MGRVQQNIKLALIRSSYDVAGVSIC